MGIYVGLSRVREASKIAIFTNEDLIFKTNSSSIFAMVKNVEYPELLTPVGITHSADTSFDSEHLNEESSDITSTYDSTQDQGIECWEALLAEMRFLRTSLTRQRNQIPTSTWLQMKAWNHNIWDMMKQKANRS